VPTTIVVTMTVANTWKYNTYPPNKKTELQKTTKLPLSKLGPIFVKTLFSFTFLSM